MKIGIDIRTLMDKRFSGVPEYAYNLLGEIFRLDRTNEYRLFYNSAKDISSRMPQFDYPNVRVVKTGYPNKWLNYVGFKIFGRPKLDELLGVDVFFMPHIGFAAFSGKKKIILTIHDLSFLRFPQFFSRRKNFWHKMLNVKVLAQKADIIVAVSENTKKDIIELCGVPQSKVKVIYSGLSDEFRRMDKNDKRLFEIREKLNLPEKFILFLGTIEPRKNISGLIEAYDALRAGRDDLSGYKLVIAGGKGWKGSGIYESWRRSPYRDDILIVGYVDKEDKACLYNLASLFVYPSFYEGFGFPPLEAMACGTPVITSHASSLPEIVGDAGIMVDPGNIADITKAVEQALSDKTLRERMVRAGLDRVGLFGWAEAARKYLALWS